MENKMKISYPNLENTNFGLRMSEESLKQDHGSLTSMIIEEILSHNHETTKFVDDIFKEIHEFRVKGYEPTKIVIGTDKYKELLSFNAAMTGRKIFATQFAGMEIIVAGNGDGFELSTGNPQHELAMYFNKN